jgi:hypothetical protein
MLLLAPAPFFTRFRCLSICALGFLSMSLAPVWALQIKNQPPRRSTARWLTVRRSRLARFSALQDCTTPTSTASEAVAKLVSLERKGPPKVRRATGLVVEVTTLWHVLDPAETDARAAPVIPGIQRDVADAPVLAAIINGLTCKRLNALKLAVTIILFARKMLTIMASGTEIKMEE